MYVCIYFHNAFSGHVNYNCLKSYMCGEFRDLAGGDYYGTPFWGRHPLEGGGRMSCGWFFFVRPLERKHRTQTHAMCIGF